MSIHRIKLCRLSMIFKSFVGYHSSYKYIRFTQFCHRTLDIFRLSKNTSLMCRQKMNLRKHYGISSLVKHLKKIVTGVDPDQKQYTNRELLAAVLHGPRNIKIECVPEEVIRPDQVRIDVHYCALTGADVLFWSGEHYKIPESPMVLGFEVTGTILELGGLAYEKTGYQRGEEVVVHNYPVCGGFAETCLANYVDVFRLARRASLEDAAALTEDYFTPMLTLGRRTQMQRGDNFIVNMAYSRTALAAVDLGTNVFYANPIVFCCEMHQAELCKNLGAHVILKDNVDDAKAEIEKIIRNGGVRVIIDTESGPYINTILPCLQFEGTVVLLSFARNRAQEKTHLVIRNFTVFTVSTGHYKTVDPFIYRETIEHLLDFRSRNIICPDVSVIFGLHHIHTAFDYYMHDRASGKILIDMKNHERVPIE